MDARGPLDRIRTGTVLEGRMVANQRHPAFSLWDPPRDSVCADVGRIRLPERPVRRFLDPTRLPRFGSPATGRPTLSS